MGKLKMFSTRETFFKPLDFINFNLMANFFSPLLVFHQLPFLPLPSPFFSLICYSAAKLNFPVTPVSEVSDPCKNLSI